MSRAPSLERGLPASLIDVAETLGARIAIKLMQAYGGQEIKFPKRPHDAHPVLVALGREDGLRLCEFLSGGLIYVPHGRARPSAVQDVLTLQAEGRGRAEIARMLGISQRHVRRVANRPADNQPSLFDKLD